MHSLRRFKEDLPSFARKLNPNRARKYTYTSVDGKRKGVFSEVPWAVPASKRDEVLNEERLCELVTNHPLHNPVFRLVKIVGDKSTLKPKMVQAQDTGEREVTNIFDGRFSRQQATGATTTERRRMQGIRDWHYGFNGMTLPYERMDWFVPWDDYPWPAGVAKAIARFFQDQVVRSRQENIRLFGRDSSYWRDHNDSNIVPAGFDTSRFISVPLDVPISGYSNCYEYMYRLAERFGKDIFARVGLEEKKSPILTAEAGFGLEGGTWGGHIGFNHSARIAPIFTLMRPTMVMPTPFPTHLNNAWDFQRRGEDHIHELFIYWAARYNLYTKEQMQAFFREITF